MSVVKQMLARVMVRVLKVLLGKFMVATLSACRSKQSSGGGVVAEGYYYRLYLM